MTYSILFFIVTIIAFIILIRIQPSGRRTLFDPGVSIVGMFSLIYLLPTLGSFFLNKSEVNIDIELRESLSLYGLVFMLSFTLFYTTCPKYFPLNKNTVKTIQITPKSCFVLILLWFVVTNIIYWNYSVYAGDYISSYVVKASMPVLIMQIMNFSGSFLWISVVLLLASSFSSTSRSKSLRFVWLTFSMFLVDMLVVNSRSHFVTFTFLFLITYTFCNRPFGLKKEIFFSVAFILFMGVFSFRREAHFDYLSVDILSIIIPSEFLSIYSNAIHLLSLVGTSAYVPPPGSSYLQSLIVLIPKQLNEGKWDLASWYVNEYFHDYAEAGGGLAFGIIPEALVNWGLISIVFQSFVLAVFFRFAYFSAYRTRSSTPNVWTIFYLFNFMDVYQLIRNTSFSIIGNIPLSFCVPYLIILTISRVSFGKVAKINCI